MIQPYGDYGLVHNKYTRHQVILQTQIQWNPVYVLKPLYTISIRGDKAESKITLSTLPLWSSTSYHLQGYIWGRPPARLTRHKSTKCYSSSDTIRFWLVSTTQNESKYEHRFECERLICTSLFPKQIELYCLIWHCIDC